MCKLFHIGVEVRLLLESPPWQAVNEANTLLIITAKDPNLHLCNSNCRVKVLFCAVQLGNFLILECQLLVI